MGQHTEHTEHTEHTQHTELSERQLDIATPDGDMPTFIVHPTVNADTDTYPVVLFQMDAPGMRSEIHDMCRRVAAEGYYVISPMLYYRWVRSYNVFETGDRDRMFELMNGLSNAMASADAAACFDHAEADPVANADKCGTVGYCMSGPFAIVVAAEHADRVRAAASIHGVRLAVDRDDSPHRRLPEVTGEIYVACAETDEYAPPEMIDKFSEAMTSAGVAGQVEWYPGTEHGFAFAERPQYVPEASEQHWDRILELFHRQLQA